MVSLIAALDFDVGARQLTMLRTTAYMSKMHEKWIGMQLWASTDLA